jgi:hypothetical protein
VAALHYYFSSRCHEVGPTDQADRSVQVVHRAKYNLYFLFVWAFHPSAGQVDPAVTQTHTSLHPTVTVLLHRLWGKDAQRSHPRRDPAQSVWHTTQCPCPSPSPHQTLRHRPPGRTSTDSKPRFKLALSECSACGVDLPCTQPGGRGQMQWSDIYYQ